MSSSSPARDSSVTQTNRPAHSISVSVVCLKMSEVYTVMVEEGKPVDATNGKPSVGPVYRCIYAKDGLLELPSRLESPWDFFRLIYLICFSHFSFSSMRLFGSAYVDLSTDISTCETIELLFLPFVMLPLTGTLLRGTPTIQCLEGDKN